MIIDGYCSVGVDREYDLTAEQLVRAMDAHEVEQAVIAPPDRWLAVRNREGNAAMLAAARNHAGRLMATCTANPWLGEEAAQEIRRAVGEGARMLVLCPPVQGFMLGDEITDPLVEAARELRIPVYVHTGSVSASPFQLGLLAERYPAVDWIMGHAGRTDYWNDVPDAVKMAPNVYLERSFSIPEIFLTQYAAVPEGRCIMASAAPLGRFDFEWREMRRSFPPDDHPGLFGENLRSLLEKRSTR